jgi:hypothetical protein
MFPARPKQHPADLVGTLVHRCALITASDLPCHYHNRLDQFHRHPHDPLRLKWHCLESYYC